MTAAKIRKAKPTIIPLAGAVDLGPMQDYVGHLQSILQESTWPKSDRTRFRLKIAAVSVLAEVGYQELKVSDICERAEVALGTFYNYFTEKSVIAAEALLDFGDALYLQAQSTARGSGDYQAILRTNQFFAAAYQRNCGLVRCLIQLEDQVPDFRPRWRERRLQWLEKIARSMARRSGHPEVPQILFMQVAYALEGLVFTYLYDVFVRQEPILQSHAGSPEHIAELLSVLWYRALYLQDPPAEEVKHVRATLALHQEPIESRKSADGKSR
jgi:AcrR family transcriptional regulator